MTMTDAPEVITDRCRWVRLAAQTHRATMRSPRRAAERARAMGSSGRRRLSFGCSTMVRPAMRSNREPPPRAGWPTLERGEGDETVGKTACDSFLGTRLEELLRERGVGRVIIAGWATDFCVDTTVFGVHRPGGFKTLAAADGHTTQIAHTYRPLKSLSITTSFGRGLDRLWRCRHRRILPTVDVRIRFRLARCKAPPSPSFRPLG